LLSDLFKNSFLYRKELKNVLFAVLYWIQKFVATRRFRACNCEPEEIQSLTPVTAGNLVPQDIYLMHSTIFLKHRPQVILIHIVRYLPHKHLYVVRIRLLHTVVVHYTAMWKESLCCGIL